MWSGRLGSGRRGESGLWTEVWTLAARAALSGSKGFLVITRPVCPLPAARAQYNRENLVIWPAPAEGATQTAYLLTPGPTPGPTPG